MIDKVQITIERAIEILDCNRRECYEEQPGGIEQVYAACSMGREALQQLEAGKLVPVRTGRWDALDDYPFATTYTCSKCGRIITISPNETLDDYPYCHCGAKMDEEWAP